MAELNTLTQHRRFELFSLDLTAFGDDIYRFANTSTYAAGAPDLGHVTWQGHTWLAFPFDTGGFQRGGENLVRPSVQVMDRTGELFANLRQMNFASGAPVVRYQVLAEDIETNSMYAPYQQPERYVLNAVKKKGTTLELELATHLDFAQRKFPGYIMTREDYPGLGSAILRG